MRTAHLFTVSQHALRRRGVSAKGGGLPRPSMQWGKHPALWTDRHLWKHNLRKLRLRAVITVDVKSTDDIYGNHNELS